MQNIGICCGSYDPPHNGHKAVIDKALEDCEKVYVIYSDPNPYKPRRTDDKTRRAMLDALLKNNPQVDISKSSRFHLPKELREKYPQSKIIGIMGSDGALHYAKMTSVPDHFKYIDGWKIIMRDGDKDEPMPESLGGKKVTVIRGVSDQGTSSTAVRDVLLKNPQFFESDAPIKRLPPVSKEVLEIIKKEKLYYLPDKKIISAINDGEEVVKVTNGLSGDRVYKTGDIFAKAIIGSMAETNSLRKKKGMERLRSLQVPSLTTPEVLSLTHHTNFSLLKMTAASGQSLDDLMKACKTSQDALNNALLSTEIVGSAIAKIHQETLKVAKLLEQTKWDQYVAVLHRTTELLRNYPRFYQGLDIASYVEAVDSLIDEMQKESPKYCTSHGDADPANWFIDDNQVTAIDCGDVADDFAEKDYYEWLSVLRLVGNRHKLGNEEIIALQKAFEKGYNKIRARDINNVSARFFRIYWLSFALNFKTKFLLNPDKYKDSDVNKAKSRISELIKQISGELKGNSLEYF
jgi:cytidyltransferase-like protein